MLNAKYRTVKPKGWKLTLWNVLLKIYIFNIDQGRKKNYPLIK